MLWHLNNYEGNPFREIRRIQEEMNRLFNGYAHDEELSAINVWTSDDKLLVTAELPGVDPKNINVSVLGEQLSIDYEHKKEELGEGQVYHRRERSAGHVLRTFRLPYEVDGTKVSAKCKNGILSIELPRAEQSKPHKISVKAS